MYGLHFRNQLPWAVVKEFEGLIAAIKSWISKEHEEDGSHVNSGVRWTNGPWVIGGLEPFSDPAFVSILIPLPLGTHHNYHPPRFETAIVVSVDTTGVGGSGSDLIFTGLQNPGDVRERRVILFRNEDNTSPVILKHENTGSTDINRFRLPNSADLTLHPNESAFLLYDVKWQRWSVAGMV